MYARVFFCNKPGVSWYAHTAHFMLCPTQCSVNQANYLNGFPHGNLHLRAACVEGGRGFFTDRADITPSRRTLTLSIPSSASGSRFLGRRRRHRRRHSADGSSGCSRKEAVLNRVAGSKDGTTFGIISLDNSSVLSIEFANLPVICTKKYV